LKAFHSEWPCPETLVIDSQITLIQSYLKKLGYQVGTIDGLLGDKTRGAIKKFQEHNNHPVTGEISVELERALKDTYYKTTEN
jgi:peptidoglycan hydrolase-like protein with peptidoglycan-binding domain